MIQYQIWKSLFSFENTLSQFSHPSLLLNLFFDPSIIFTYGNPKTSFYFSGPLQSISSFCCIYSIKSENHLFPFKTPTNLIFWSLNIINCKFLFGLKDNVFLNMSNALTPSASESEFFCLVKGTVLPEALLLAICCCCGSCLKRSKPLKITTILPDGLPYRLS